jgi:hypothetical protein
LIDEEEYGVAEKEALKVSPYGSPSYASIYKFKLEVLTVICIHP